jgi:lysophospholipase L1-like esterase
MKNPRWFIENRFFSSVRITGAGTLLSAAAAMTLMAAPPGLSIAAPDSPAASDTHAVHYYVSLGDSLAASYQPNGDFTHGYAEQLFADLKAHDPTLRLVKLGCGGETTASMIFDNSCGYPHGSQLAEAVSFLHAHRQFVRLVTLDIGGNDVLLCVFYRDQGCLDAALPSMATNLATIVSTLREAAGPDVPIVGMNYYDPFLAFWFSDPTAAQITEQMVVQVNDVLGSAYSTASDPVADVETAFSTTDWTPVDGIPLNVLRICQWTWMCTNSPDIHLNPAGYGVSAQAFLDALP